MRKFSHIQSTGFVFLILGLCVGAPLSADGKGSDKPGSWSFVKEEKGVKVYSKDEPNSSVVFIKGEAVIDGPAELVFKVLSDTKRTHEWIENLAEKRVVESFSKDERTIYTHVDMPWPLSDRYFVSRSKTTRLGGVIYISGVSTDSPNIEDDGKVRGHIYASNFKLTPVAVGTRTHVIVEMKTDPKGMIPKWLVNSFQEDMPVDFFNNLNTQVKRIVSEHQNTNIKLKADADLSH